MLTCAACGNEEPEGSRFCGECGASFAPADQPLAHAVAADAVLAETPVEVEPRPEPTGSRLRWAAAGAAVVFLVAGGAAVAVLTLTGDDGSPEAVSTEDSLLTETIESEPTATSSLADSVRPRIAELVGSQDAVGDQVRSLEAGAGSLGALRQAGDALADAIVRTQGFLDGLATTGTTDAATLTLVQAALAAHLAYAEAISDLPAQAQALTRAQAQSVRSRAEEAQVAYGALASGEPALSGVALSGADHAHIIELVPAKKPPPQATTIRRVIELAPLLVGIRPDDPLGEGRCFGAYTSRATLSVSGVVHRGGFVQCGDDSNGDPGRTSGIYAFSGQQFPAGSRPLRLTAQAAIDESSSSSQRGTSVTWTVLYDGEPICSRTVTWSGSRPSPTKLDCRFPPAVAAGGLDLRRLRIQQVAFPASSGSLWAGLLDPTIVAEVPG